MSRNTWNLWFRRAFGNAPAKRVVRRSCQLGLVSLEDRLTPNATITVSTVNDTVDGLLNDIPTLIANPGADNKISLREAIAAANNTSSSGTSLASANVINLPNGTYSLSKGELVVAASKTGNVTNLNIHIVGASQAGTIIQHDTASANSRVLTMGTITGSQQNVHLNLSNMTIQKGRAEITNNGGAIVLRNDSGNSASFNNVRFFDNQIVGGTANDNGGAIGTFGNTGFGVSASATNCIFDSNKTNQGSGGAIAWEPETGNVSKLTVTGCTFTNNTAVGVSGGGGAIYTAPAGVSTNSAAIITRTSFTGNTVTSGTAFGGGAIYSRLTPLTVSQSSFANNAVTTAGTGQNGGGAIFTSTTNQPVTINYNRFVNNTAAKPTAGNQLFVSTTTNTNANDNWWSRNTGPNATDIAGITPATWLQFRNIANPPTLNPGSTAEITADFLGRNSGGPIAASNLVGLPNVSLGFANATLGTISITEALMVDGVAKTIFGAGLTTGVGGATAYTDGTSATANVNIGTPPVVTDQPDNLTITAGATAKFTIAVTGNPAPAIQWQRSVGVSAFVNIAGATSASYTTPATTAADNDNFYRAVVSNFIDTVISKIGLLTVQYTPGITEQPSNTTIVSGNPAIFEAAAVGNPAPTVQWQRSVNNAAFVNISGATATTYTSPATTPANNGNRYRAIFTNSVGTGTSNIATLTVQSAPSVTAQPTSKTINLGQTATFTAAATGNPAPTVQWRVSVANAPFIDIIGAISTSYTTPAAIASNNGNRYVAVFSNGVGSPATTSIATLSVAGVTGIVVNNGDAQRSRLTNITVNLAAPFDAATLAAPGAITLTRGSTVVQTGAVGPNGRILVSPATGLVSSITLSFDNADGTAVTSGVESGSLADGRWQLAIASLGYSSTLNDPNLRRLFGDSDNNGSVDASDFAAFGNAFGATLANSPFDWDNNVSVDASDLANFGNRFGLAL